VAQWIVPSSGAPVTGAPEPQSLGRKNRLPPAHTVICAHSPIIVSPYVRSTRLTPCGAAESGQGRLWPALRPEPGTLKKSRLPAVQKWDPMGSSLLGPRGALPGPRGPNSGFWSPKQGSQGHFWEMPKVGKTTKLAIEYKIEILAAEKAVPIVYIPYILYKALMIFLRSHFIF
jgi:hypothetical protein